MSARQGQPVHLEPSAHAAPRPSMKDHDLSALLAQAGGGAAESTDWREYYHAVRQRFWIVLLTMVVGGIIAALYMSRQETVFRARSVLFLEQEQDRVLKDVKSVREEQIRNQQLDAAYKMLKGATPENYAQLRAFGIARAPALAGILPEQFDQQVIDAFRRCAAASSNNSVNFAAFGKQMFG